jgi:predicted HicB family RNase H-like nuclease
MEPKKNLSRITIDLPEQDHKLFKAMAAAQGKTMRELVVEFIKSSLQNTRSINFNESSKE